MNSPARPAVSDSPALAVLSASERDQIRPKERACFPQGCVLPDGRNRSFHIGRYLTHGTFSTWCSTRCAPRPEHVENWRQQCCGRAPKVVMVTGLHRAVVANACHEGIEVVGWLSYC